MTRGRIPTAGLAALGALALVAAVVVAYLSRAVFDADRFADRASAALADEAVSDRVAERVSDELVAADPDLIAFRPVLEGVVAGIVREGAFQSLFRAGVNDLHRAVFERDQSTLTLTLADIGATLRGVLQALQPRLARQLPPQASVELVEERLPEAGADLARIADTARWLPLAFLALALVAFAGAVRLAAERRSGAVAVGIAVTTAAALGLVAMRGGEAALVSGVDDRAGRDAVGAVWAAFLGDLQTALLLVAACGAVVTAAASSLLRPVDVRSQLGRAWALVSEAPERPAWRALRAVLLLAAGVLIVVRHEAFLELVAIAAGLYAAYAGAAELMRMTLAGPGAAGEARAARRRPLVASAIVFGAIVGAGALFIGVGGLGERPLAVGSEGCNGDPVLCERPYDEVAVPATHNSMSAPYPGYLFAQQDAPIAAQLRDGVRGLMIDAHYGVETESGRVKTDLSDLSRGERATYEESLGPAALDAALRLRDRAVNSPEAGEPGVYFCHRFCELGAVPIRRVFGDLRDFMAANPDEVVTVVIEDYVAPQAIAAAAAETGLIDQIYKGPVGPPWPTLGEIIASGGRVVMMAENDAGGGEVPWYHSAYEGLVQETPFRFDRPAELIDRDLLPASCRPNRGTPDSSLFLVNHWIDTSPAPRPSNAARVNTRDALLARIDRCEEQRDLLANLVAVDFYREGDLFGAVRELNRERASAPIVP